MSSVAIGIDLGTTFSVVAHVNRHGVPEVLPNQFGERITPSVIFFDKEQISIGLEAERGAVAYPTQVVQFVKRHIGDPDFKFNYGGKDWSAVELSAQIVKDLVRGASHRLQQEITQAVITVPAYFGQNERKATIRAAEAAGLEVLKIINEPTAAAVAYGLNHLHTKTRCLVFDLGGGTFDVTIIEIDKNNIRVRSTDGDHKLGGKDWDDRLMKYVTEAFKEQHGIDIMADPVAQHELRSRCVSTKISLTMRPEINLDFRHKNKPLRLKITRNHFEALTADLLLRCEEKTRAALEAANYTTKDIDTILLVGGSTRMPMVRRRIKDMFQKDPSTEINPDECVALGAALTAAIESAIKREEEPPVDIRTHDVAGHQLGLVVYKDQRLFNAPIIKKNTPIPCEQTRGEFVTIHDAQAMIDLWLVQGDRKNPLDKNCHILGHFEFFGIPAREARQTKVAITYRYNANGIVEVEASDMNSKKMFSHRLAKDRYTLREVEAGKVPANIAIIVDTSGSMYGAPIEEAKGFIRRFANQNLRNNRSIALFSYPDGIIGTPSNKIDALEESLNKLTSIGYSTIHPELKRSKEQLKGRGGIYIIISDGRVRYPSEIKKYCEKIHRSGGKIFVVGVGDHKLDEQLTQLCIYPKDYISSSDTIDITKNLVNLIQQV
jgi:molecular chaperone DnaK